MTLLGEALVTADGDRLLVRAHDSAELNRYLVGLGARVSAIGPQRRDLEQVVLEAVRTA